jgi:hypothetical protein
LGSQSVLDGGYTFFFWYITSTLYDKYISITGKIVFRDLLVSFYTFLYTCDTYNFYSNYIAIMGNILFYLFRYVISKTFQVVRAL